MTEHECPSCGQVHREKPTNLKSRVEILESKVQMLEARLPAFTWTTPSWPSYYIETTVGTATPEGPSPSASDSG